MAPIVGALIPLTGLIALAWMSLKFIRKGRKGKT